MKLEGLTVVDLSVFPPGPYLTMTLADHGAQGLKIEPPGDDPGRQIGPPIKFRHEPAHPRLAVPCRAAARQERKATAGGGVAP